MSTKVRVSVASVVACLALVMGVSTASASTTGALGAPNAVVGVTAPPATTQAPAQAQQARGWVGAVIKAIKRYGSRVWNACVNAVRRGYAAFKAWYDGLPWYVKAAIKVASGGATVYDLYMAIKDVIGGEVVVVTEAGTVAGATA